MTAYPILLEAHEAHGLLDTASIHGALLSPLTGRVMAFYRCPSGRETVLLEGQGDRITFGWRATPSVLFWKLVTLRTDQARGWVGEYLHPKGFRLVSADATIVALSA